MKSPIKNNHFIWLAIAMVGMMLASAFSRDIPDSLTLRLFEYSSLALLLLSLLSLKSDRKWGKVLMTILGVMVAVVVVRGVTEVAYFDYFYLSLLLAFMLTAGWLVGSQVLLTGSVNLNVIVGSLTLYLILGYIWSIFYTFLLEFSPHALNGIEPATWYDNLPYTIYFSFVTLTTLGYGDISPATPIAQVLVLLEAVTGMFYLAVIVASLIGSMRKQ